jgi:hypothetical protein
LRAATNDTDMKEPRTAKAIAFGMWLLLAMLFVSWAAFLWHPWIDWFGRPR